MIDPASGTITTAELPNFLGPATRPHISSASPRNQAWNESGVGPFPGENKLRPLPSERFAWWWDDREMEGGRVLVAKQ